MYFSLNVDDQIELQLLEEDHADPLFRLVDSCRDELDRWLPWVRHTTTADDTEQFIRRKRSDFGAGRSVTTAIVHRGELCGSVGLDIDDRTGDIGYWLHPDHQGEGVMTRSCRTLIDYGFTHYGLHRIVIRASPQNDKSCAVPERLDFTHEGTLREAGPHPDGYFDLRLYALLRREWRDD